MTDSMSLYNNVALISKVSEDVVSKVLKIAIDNLTVV